MKLKKYNLSVGDLYDLLVWAQGFSQIEGKEFAYSDKLSNLYGVDRGVNMDVSDYVDDLFVYLYSYYETLSKADFGKELENNPFFNFFDKTALEETINSAKNFVEIYKRLYTEYKFDNPESRGIQKNLIEELLNKNIEAENYEICAELTEKLKEV